MLIHFVCTGNTFRSRLAEAYLNSLQLENVKAVSSGISAEKNVNGTTTWYAQRLVQYHLLIPFYKKVWTQTRIEDIKKSDRVIFMTELHFEKFQKKFDFTPEHYEIWDIKDLDDLGFRDENKDIQTDQKRILTTEEIYKEIREKIDKFVREVS